MQRGPTDESALRLSDVDHIPQTTASHHYIPMKGQDETIDLKLKDPRDTFYKGDTVVFLNGMTSFHIQSHDVSISVSRQCL